MAQPMCSSISATFSLLFGTYTCAPPGFHIGVCSQRLMLWPPGMQARIVRIAGPEWARAVGDEYSSYQVVKP